MKKSNVVHVEINNDLAKVVFTSQPEKVHQRYGSKWTPQQDGYSRMSFDYPQQIIIKRV